MNFFHTLLGLDFFKAIGSRSVDVCHFEPLPINETSLSNKQTTNAHTSHITKIITKRERKAKSFEQFFCFICFCLMRAGGVVVDHTFFMAAFMPSVKSRVWLFKNSRCHFGSSTTVRTGNREVIRASVETSTTLAPFSISSRKTSEIISQQC